MGWGKMVGMGTSALRRGAVHLRVVNPGDYDLLYGNISSRPFREHFRGNLPGPDEFVQRLWSNVFAQMIAEVEGEETPLGLYIAHSASLSDGYAYVTEVSLRDDCYGERWVASEKFITFLFSEWQLRRIYREVPEHRLDAFHQTAGGTFAEQGALRDHDFIAGGYVSRHVFVATREAWNRAVSA
jgi:hypothetical protein